MSFMRNVQAHNTLVTEWVGEYVIGSHLFSEVARLPQLRQGLDDVARDVTISTEMDNRLPCLRYIVVYTWRHNPFFKLVVPFILIQCE